MKYLAVVGDPITHSKSPQIHNHLLKKYNIAGHYTRLHAISASHALELAKALSITGLNITAPFKEDFTHIIKKDLDVEVIGATNTIIINNSTDDLKGYNTDWKAVYKIIHDYLTANNLSNTSALILGNGGASKACVYAVEKLNIKYHVACRNKNDSSEVLFSSEDFQILSKSVDIIINTLPSEVYFDFDYRFKENSLFIDANYKDIGSIRKKAQINKCKIVEGIKWLEYQAIEAFNIFCGKELIYEGEPFLYSDKLKNKKIILIGMMGSGKSSVCREFSDNGIKSIDLDDYIESKVNKSVTQIFSENGEQYFRELELKYLTEILNDDYRVISLGGGTLLNPKNQELIKNHLRVFLFTSINFLAKRLYSQKSVRPIISDCQSHAELEDKLAFLLKSRLSVYYSNSDLILDSGILSSNDIYQELKNETHIL
jgi:shikimate dehydrogenase